MVVAVALTNARRAPTADRSSARLLHAEARAGHFDHLLVVPRAHAANHSLQGRLRHRVCRLQRLVQRQLDLRPAAGQANARPRERGFLPGQGHISRLMPVPRVLPTRVPPVTLAAQPRDFRLQKAARHEQPAASFTFQLPQGQLRGGVVRLVTCGNECQAARRSQAAKVRRTSCAFKGKKALIGVTCSFPAKRCWTEQ